MLAGRRAGRKKGETKVNMTESEIAVYYRQARDRPRQLVILSQLNACKPGEIAEILLRHGVAPDDLPKRYHRGGGQEAEGPPKPKIQRICQKRDPETGKIICPQCGTLFDGNSWKIYCHVCRKKRETERIQRAKEKREAEYAANPKRCADCGAVLENRLLTYCKTCAEARAKESERRSNRRSYLKRKKEEA